MQEDRENGKSRKELEENKRNLRDRGWKKK